jgi:hypothetical protein
MTFLNYNIGYIHSQNQLSVANRACDACMCGGIVESNGCLLSALLPLRDRFCSATDRNLRRPSYTHRVGTYVLDSFRLF